MPNSLAHISLALLKEFPISSWQPSSSKKCRLKNYPKIALGYSIIYP
jgi:hypothetical protein